MNETQVHNSICKEIKLKYKNIIFHSDPSGMVTSIGMANRIKTQTSNDSIPDLFIAEPRKGYHGLYIEIKVDRDKLYTKKGKLRNTEHLIAQRSTVHKLRKKGYYAVFGLGVSHSMKIIDRYMNL